MNLDDTITLLRRQLDASEQAAKDLSESLRVSEDKCSALKLLDDTRHRLQVEDMARIGDLSAKVTDLRNFIAWVAGQYSGIAPDSIESAELCQMAKASVMSGKTHVRELESKLNHEVYCRDKVAGERDKAESKVKELEQTVTVHYKPQTYYYDLLVMTAKALGREHDGNEVPVANLAIDVGLLKDRLKAFETATRQLRDTPPGDWELKCNGEAFNNITGLLLT